MPVPPPRISRRRGAGAAGGGRRRFGGGSAPGRRRPRAQGRVCGRGGAGPAPGIRTVSRRWRDRDPAPFRAADTEVGAANARLLERCRPAGPPEGAGLGARGSRTCEGAGRTAGRQAQSQIAEDIFGAEEVEAKRYPDGGMRSQIRRWVKSPRPGGRRLAQPRSPLRAGRMTRQGRGRALAGKDNLPILEDALDHETQRPLVRQGLESAPGDGSGRLAVEHRMLPGSVDQYPFETP